MNKNHCAVGRYVDVDCDLESTEHPRTLSLEVNRPCNLGPDFGRGDGAFDKRSRIVHTNTTEISTTRTGVHNFTDEIQTHLNSVAVASGQMERVETGVVAPYTAATDRPALGYLVTGTRRSDPVSLSGFEGSNVRAPRFKPVDVAGAFKQESRVIFIEMNGSVDSRTI